MTNYAKALARLVRAFDHGRLSLLFMLSSLVIGALLAMAELSGLDGLCVRGTDEVAFVALSSLCSACLVLAFVLRRSPILAWPLTISGLSCLAFVLYFPVSPISSLAFTMYVALPLSLYSPFPRSLTLPALVLAAFLALRFAIFGPETLGQRSASFRDGLLFVALPLLASSLAAAASAFRIESDRIAESLMEVTRLNLSYQDYSASVEEKSALDERLRLTRDIHDVVGYALTNAIMTMRAASLMCEREPGKAPAFLDAARADAEGALGRVRAMLGDLRKREIRIAAGPSSIAKAVRAFKAATGAEVDVDYGNFDWSLGREAAFAASHFVQEGMLNAVSHGKATAIRVSFREDEGVLSVSVKDNGFGAETVEEGIGIAGMRERIAKLGGALEYGSSGPGFSILMRLPIDAAPVARGEAGR